MSAFVPANVLIAAGLLIPGAGVRLIIYIFASYSHQDTQTLPLSYFVDTRTQIGTDYLAFVTYLDDDTSILAICKSELQYSFKLRKS